MKLLSYSLYGLLIADVIYQGWGIPTSVNWSVYYDLIHYCFAFLMSIFAVISIKRYKIISWIFIAYFGFISIYQMFYFGMDATKYWAEKSDKVPQTGWFYFSVCLIIVLLFHLQVKKINNESKR